MSAKFSDQEIEKFIEENKKLADDLWKQITLRSKRGHKEHELSLTGENGNQFKLILRESDINPLDFSVILALSPIDTTQLFRLRRYNGKSHEHTNKIERNTFYDFHIHYATQRYQEYGMREDAYAESTDRYSNLKSALNCLIEDCHFETSRKGILPLFEELDHDHW